MHSESATAHNKTMKKIAVFTLVFLAFYSLSAIEASAKTAPEERKLPILMYHSVLCSEIGAYTVSPERLEADLVELKRRGYESVTVGEVKRFLKGKGTLPEKPVLLTFDDGHYNNLYYARALLEKHGFTAALHVIGCFTEYSSTHEKDRPEYSHLTWDEIGELSRSGVFEIGSHSYAMHAYKPRFGIKRKKGENEEDYERALREDTARLERCLLEKSGVIPVSYAYPFGAYDETSERILRSLGYEVLFTCYERINVLKFGNEAKLARLNRINRDGTIETERFLNAHGIL